MFKVIINLFSGLFLTALVSTNAIAVEITNYKISLLGTHHYITVAKEPLEKFEVKCVITKNGKPVSAGTYEIRDGVGTIEMHIAGGINKTKVSCVEIK